MDSFRSHPDPPAVAIVTGGASGIGLATVRELSARGLAVVIADLDLSAAERAASEVGGLGGSAAVDVTSSASVEELFAHVGDRYDRLDGLVNCAGIARPGESRVLADEDWEALMAVHLSGTMRCCRAAYPLLEQSRGAIVNISSVAARVGMPKRLAYAAAKSGIEAVTRTLAVEWAGAGIRVNAVAPGYTQTALIDELFESGRLDRDRLLARIPFGRLAQASEIAAVVDFLISPSASYVTGQCIVADGGMIVDGDWY